MWVIVHTYVGLAIGSALHLPWWALALIAVGSHIPLDLIPHWDYTVTRRHAVWGWVDFLGALATVLFCWLVLGAPLALVALGPISAAPDLDVLYRAIEGKDETGWFPSHWRRFPHGACAPAPGIAVQAAITAACAAVVIAAWS